LELGSDGGDLAYMPGLVDRDRQLWRRQRPGAVVNVPGLRCAVRMSIEWIRACACGERTITA
jgi:hypothetical protein